MASYSKKLAKLQALQNGSWNVLEAQLKGTRGQDRFQKGGYKKPGTQRRKSCY